MESSVDIAQLGKLPTALVHAYHSEIVSTIRLSVRFHGPTLIQASIAWCKPRQPVSTGEYKRNWKVRNITDGAMLYNPTVQAGIIEDGRRKGYGVSKQGQEAIARWAHLHGMDELPPLSAQQRARRRKMGRLFRKAGLTRIESTEAFKRRRVWTQENRARGIAFLIARAIKRRGLPAKNVLGRVEPELKTRVLNDVSDTIAKGPAR